MELLIAWLVALGWMSRQEMPVPTPPLLKMIQSSKSIVLVELRSVAKQGIDPDRIGQTNYHLRVQPAEKWLGPFPLACDVHVSLPTSEYAQIKAGDRAILFVSSAIDAQATTRLEGSDLGLAGRGFWLMPIQTDGRYVLTRHAPAGAWLVTRGLKLNDPDAMLAHAENLFTVIRDVVKAIAAKPLQDDTFTDDHLAPLLNYFDKADEVGRTWVTKTIHTASSSCPLNSRTLPIIVKEIEWWSEPHQTLEAGRSMRRAFVNRLNERKPGDQVPDYLRNLPKDDDEAIQQALERFLREYAKDKQNGK